MVKDMFYCWTCKKVRSRKVQVTAEELMCKVCGGYAVDDLSRVIIQGVNDKGDD